jgi:hypothetical protein
LETIAPPTALACSLHTEPGEYQISIGVELKRTSASKTSKKLELAVDCLVDE